MSMYHLWSRYNVSDEDTLRRHAIAQSTWSRVPWSNLPIPDERLPRLFNCHGKKLPYLRDLFDLGCAGRRDDDVVVYTNADIGVVTTVGLRIAVALQSSECGYGSRRDLHKRVVAVPADGDIVHWHHYPGTDLVFFRVRWWKKNRLEMPDMLPAREAWDPCLRILMGLTEPGKQLMLELLCWHERHGSTNGYWEDPKNRYSLPGQIHNLTLAKQFMRKHGHNPANYGVK